MKDQDLTEKDAAAPTDSRAVAAPKAAASSATWRELTDAEFATVAGGVRQEPSKHPGQ